jgi:hypothetical protein
VVDAKATHQRWNDEPMPAALDPADRPVTVQFKPRDPLETASSRFRPDRGRIARAFRALAEKGINIRAITTSEIKFSVLIDAAYTELAVGPEALWIPRTGP